MSARRSARAGYWGIGPGPPPADYDEEFLLYNPVPLELQIDMEPLNPTDDNGDEIYGEDDAGPRLGFVQSKVHIQAATDIPSDVKVQLIALLDKFAGTCMTQLRRKPIDSKAFIPISWKQIPNPIHKTFPMYGAKLQHLQEEASMLVKKQLAVRASGTWSSPTFVVPKMKDGKIAGIGRWLT